jgi:DNA-directed RNA polymerase subunit M/transcription elongation factor TFIIS
MIECPKCGEALYIMWQDGWSIGLACNNCKVNYKAKIKVRN